MTKAPKLFQIRHESDLDRIPFVNGMAAVMIPARLLPKIQFTNDSRGDSPRLAALERSIRNNGYQPHDPIKVRIGRKGRWVVIDGGHRLTAVRHILREFWTNLFRRKVRDVYVVLFTTEESWADTDHPERLALALGDDPASLVQAAWERSGLRRRSLET